jgi:hypothetical protein
VSSDFGFWKRGAGDPADIFDRLAEGDTSDLASDPAVKRFRDGLLARWADIEDALEPSTFDLEDSPDDVLKYVLLTLSVRQLDHLPEILSLAQDNGLVGFSGVAGEPI